MRAVHELHRHLRQLQRCRHGQYKGQLTILVHHLKATEPFRSMLAHLRAAAPDFDPVLWANEKILNERRGRHEWPLDETERMKTLAEMLREMTTDRQEPLAWAARMLGHGNFEEHASFITSEVVAPLLDYLLGQIGTESDMLHKLGRFKRLVESFDKADLYAAYEANKRQGEAIYDKALRRFLFMEGIDYAIPQAESASGKADVIADIDADDALVLELKLFDGVKKTAAYIGKGLGQAVAYAKDFGKPVGHLVVINLTENRLDIPSDEPSETNLRIVVEGVTVFITIVDGKPQPSASERGKPKVVTFKREQLITEAQLVIDGDHEAEP